MLKAYVNKDSIKVIDVDIEGKDEEVMLELSILIKKVFDEISFNSKLNYKDLILALEYILIDNEKQIKEYIEKGEAFENGLK